MSARHTPKIGASQKPALPYEYDSALNMHLLGPGEPALSEWREAGLRTPDMSAIRAHRLARVRGELRARDIAAVVLTDPLEHPLRRRLHKHATLDLAQRGPLLRCRRGRADDCFRLSPVRASFRAQPVD